MAMVKEIKLYSFEELAKDVQEKLIEERRENTWYGYQSENRDSIEALEDLLHVKCTDWQYDTYAYYVSIDVDYDVYEEKYLEYLIKKGENDKAEQVNKNMDYTYSQVKELKGEELQGLLYHMYGEDLKKYQDWWLTGYYLDCVSLELVQKVYAGKLDVTLEKLLDMVFNKTLGLCRDDMREYFSDEEMEIRIEEDNYCNPYCYLEDGTYVA